MIIPKSSGTRQHVGTSPRSTRLPMTATVLVLLGLTFWLTSFKKMRVTITKPADTDPPYIIRRNEPIELEGIADDRGNVYQQFRVARDQMFFQGPSGDQWRARSLEYLRVWSTESPRDSGREFGPPPMAPGESAYITASGTQDRSGASFVLRHHSFVSNVVRVRVE